jgi:hypothetical protein
VKFPRATRLVFCCRGTAEDAMAAMPGMISKPKLTVNDERTRLCLLPEESFDSSPRLYDGQKPTLTLCRWAESRTEAYPGKTKTTRRTPD